MKIIFYKSQYGNWVDKLISILTFSKYSHCELVFSNGMCATSSVRDGGIRMKMHNIDDHWDSYDLVGNFDEDTITYWFSINSNDTYDWLGAIGSLFHIDLTSEDKKFCSYSCAISLGINPIITPEKLFQELKKQGIINV